MSTYTTAIEQTISTINKRAKYFRNLIIAVVVNGVLALGWMLTYQSPLPLFLLLLLFPICGCFYFLDVKLLANWQRRLLLCWTRGEIDFGALNAAIMANPILPKDTVAGMLTTLPSSADLLTEHRWSLSLREALAAVVMTISICRSDAIALRTGFYALASISIIAAVVFRVWEPLPGLLSAALLPLLQKSIKRVRLRNLKQKTLGIQTQSDIDLKQFEDVIIRIDWEPITSQEKDSFLTRLVSTALPDTTLIKR